MAANLNQQQAIEATAGPVLIIAGPGSGKTFTLVERIVNLITSAQATPESLMVSTFTDKAARELMTRISNRLLELGLEFNHSEMLIGTFHSICLRIVEEYREFTRLKRSFTLMDQFDQQYFIYENVYEFAKIENYDLVVGKTQPRWSQSEALMKSINKVTEEALTADKLKGFREDALVALGKIYELYEELLHKNNALDFSGIQLEALRLLDSAPAVLHSLKERLTHIMVDEYQDTNTIQEMILNRLLDDHQNICVVGDDDQGLYRFRGATIRNILEFPNLFDADKCKQIKLDTNYRSHPGIISFYGRWMEEEQWEKDGKSFRFDKAIKPRQDVAFLETATVVKLLESGADVYHDEVLTFLHKLKDSGKLQDWNQVAFLFNSVRNDRVLDLARFLEQKGIPVYSPRSNMFFEREEVRLALGAIIFMLPQFQKARKWAEDAHMDIWDYLDNDCFALFAERLRQPENEDLRKWCAFRAKEHFALAEPTDYAFSGLLYQLFRFPLFSHFLDQEQMLGLDKGRAARNLAMLSKLLVKFESLNRITVFNPEYLERDIRKLFNQFLHFLRAGGINEFEDDSEYAPSGCVSFMTIHQSKGLEFPVVLVSSLHAVPRSQHTNIDALLEETNLLTKPPYEPLENTKFYDFRRLFYTAFSRAQNLLVLADQKRTSRGSGTSPSKYFRDIVEELPSWRDGAFDLSKIEFEPVKTINLKKEYSFTSHITVFETCPEQYRFFRELEFNPIRQAPQLFGTLVHQTIEDMHKAVLRGEENKVTTKNIEDWFQSNYTNLIQREKTYLAEPAKKAALKQVLQYYDREHRNWDRIKEAEVELSLVKDHYILTGSVDLIRGEDNTVEIVDFKAEKKPDMEKDKDRLQLYARQLKVYAHLVEEKTGHPVSKMHLYYTGEESGNPYVTFPRDTKSINDTIAQFDQTVSRIEAKDYTMHARPVRLCENCDMRFYCDFKETKVKSCRK